METWKPATLDEVQSILRDDSQGLHYKHRQLFEKMRIQPMQIPVVRYPGEAVWALAEHGGKFLYWSDIEDGWELDALQPGGGIQDRGCNQYELHHIMYQLFGNPDLLPLNLSEYLIDQQGHDWSTILTEWHWLLPTDLTVWMVNRFGDVIFVSEDDTVHLLDIGAGSVKQLAASREDFFTQVEAGDNADNWLLICYQRSAHLCAQSFSCPEPSY